MPSNGTNVFFSMFLNILVSVGGFRWHEHNFSDYMWEFTFVHKPYDGSTSDFQSDLLLSLLSLTQLSPFQI